MLPPIRYPLPTILALALASLMAWQAAVLSRGWRAEMAARVKRSLEGPEVPNSPRPKAVAGRMTRRALLLRDTTPATNPPKGPTVETIDRRMFVDVYDIWPEPGPITHVRVGIRGPIGWVKAGDLLEWDTRLVVRPPGGRVEMGDSPTGPSRLVEVGDAALPVLSWTDRAVEVATWQADRPWEVVARRGWIPLADLPRGAWGVWISQVELPILLGLANQGEAPLVARVRAVLGRLADNKPWNIGDLDAIRSALPGVVFAREPDPSGASGRLAEANARPSGDATWAGLSFRFLPLDDLP